MGSIAITTGDSEWGHVAYVEAINGNQITTLNGGYTQWNTGEVGRIGRIVGTAAEQGIIGYWKPNGGVNASQPYFTDQTINFTDAHNAEVFARIQNPSKMTVSSVGCRLYNSSGSQIKSYMESCSWVTSYVNYTCNFISDMNYELTPGTEYKYQLFAIVNGNEYKDSVRSFKTTGNLDSSVPKIQDIEIVVQKEYFKVCLTVTDETKLNDLAVKYDAWTSNNGKDDVINQYATYSYMDGKKSDTKKYYEAFVYKSDHNNEEGSYNINLIISDAAGNVTTYNPGEIIMSDYLYTVENGTVTIKSMPTEEEEIVVPSKLGNYYVTQFYGEKGYSSSKVRKITFSYGIKEIWLGGLSRTGEMILDCPQLEKIVIPDSVIAFGGVSSCEKLEEITLPSNLQILGTISNCPKIKSITIPDTVTSIVGFRECSSLESIELPVQLQTIGMDAFRNCSSLRTINLPRNFEKFDMVLYTTSGHNPFLGCSSLEEVTIDVDNPYLCIENDVIMDKDKKNILFYTDLSDGEIDVPESVRTIGTFAFSGTNVKNVSLPKGLEEIGFSAFSGCKKLTEVSVPESVLAVGKYAFKDDTNIEKVLWNDKCKKILEYTFAGCKNLKELIVPYGVKTIEYGVVEGDYNLEKITIPSSILEDSFFDLGEIVRYISTYPKLKVYMKLNGKFDQYWKQYRDSAYAQFNESYIVYDDTVDFEKITFANNEMVMNNVGDKQGVDFTLNPTSLDTSLISWSVEDTSIAYINQDGIVTARKEGKTNVIASIKVVGEYQSYIIPLQVGKKGAEEIITDKIVETTTKQEVITNKPIEKITTKPYMAKVIKPSKVTGLKIKNINKKKIKVSWKWKSYSCKYGWQVQYARKRNFKGAKIKNVNWLKESLILKNLKKKKTYYVRARVWTKSNGIKRFGSWSVAKRVKIKK